MGTGSIPVDRVGFDIDEVVADIMTTFLDLAQEHQGPPPFRYEDIITFSLKEFGSCQRRPGRQAALPLDSRQRVFRGRRLETWFDLARAGLTPIVFALPWNRKPHAGWPDLARLLFDEKGEGGYRRGAFPSAPHEMARREYSVRD